eukprot:2002406-Rhodomonas_salina.1
MLLMLMLMLMLMPKTTTTMVMPMTPMIMMLEPLTFPVGGRRVTVPSEQYPTLGDAFRDADNAPCVTLHVTLLRGEYEISEPLQTRGRIVVQAEVAPPTHSACTAQY